MRILLIICILIPLQVYAAKMKQIVVAVIDTGIDIDHSAFRGVLWENKAERGLDRLGRDKSTNGIDDDKNGFIDDVNGWNFANKNNDLKDEHGHGTHIAGIIGAKNRGLKTSSGVANNVKLMVLKYYNPKLKSSDNIANTIKAIDYAVKMGARVINYSSGGDKSSLLESRAIRRAESKNVVFVSAAGNEARNSDMKPFYPANYQLPNIISVGSVDKNRSLSNFSNYGSRSVMIAAGGDKVFSTLPNESYGIMSGTSQSAAYVSGVAALVLGTFPYVKNPYQLRKIILNTAQEDKSLSVKVKGGKIIDEQRALKIVDKGVDAFGRSLVYSTNKSYQLE